MLLTIPAKIENGSIIPIAEMPASDLIQRVVLLVEVEDAQYKSRDFSFSVEICIKIALHFSTKIHYLKKYIILLLRKFYNRTRMTLIWRIFADLSFWPFIRANPLNPCKSAFYF